MEAVTPRAMRQLRIVGVGAALLATAVISIYVTAPSDEIELQDHLAQHARVGSQDVMGGDGARTNQPRPPSRTTDSSMQPRLPSARSPPDQGLPASSMATTIIQPLQQSDPARHDAAAAPTAAGESDHHHHKIRNTTPRWSKPRVPYQCQSHALHHNQSVAEQGRAYSRHGEPISLLDAFAVHPRCSRLSPNGTGGVGGASCSPVPLATFVFNVKVFEFEMQSEEPVKLRGPALRRGQRRQKQV
jgi:hypothetical protein